MTWKRTTEQITVSGDGESIFTAGQQVNTYFNQLSTGWFAFTYQYSDARAQQVLNVPFSKLDSNVVDYLTGGYYFDTMIETNLVMDKLYQLPEDKHNLMYYEYWDPELYPQKPGINDAVRCLYYNGFTNLYSFANNKVLSDSYSDFTGVIGNIYYEDKTVDIVTNGIVYNYSAEEFKPGEVYYLTDLMDGWMIPYQEGGDGDLVSVPMAVAVHKNSAILLTERAMVKDLPCFPKCPPTRLRFYKDEIIYQHTDAVDCNNVKLHVSSNDATLSHTISSSVSPAVMDLNGVINHSIDEVKIGNTSLFFPGDEDGYIKFNNTGMYNLGSDPFTIEFWIWFDDSDRHDFILGLWDDTLRRRGWMIESPSDSSGHGTGMVFSANQGTNEDDFNIRVGCDYKFNKRQWYHVSLFRENRINNANIPVSDWTWCIDGIKQTNKLTAGKYNCTIPDYNAGRFVIGAPSLPVETYNVDSITTTNELTAVGIASALVDPVPSEIVELTLGGGELSGEYVVNLSTPVSGADYTIHQIEPANVNDLVEVYLKDSSNSWEKVLTHISTSGFNNMTAILPVSWRTKYIHSIKWRYTPVSGGSRYLKLKHVELRQQNKPIDWAVTHTGRSQHTVPLHGYMNEIRLVTNQSVYNGNHIVPLSAHENCNAVYDGPVVTPCSDVLLHIQSDTTVESDLIEDFSNKNYTISYQGTPQHKTSGATMGMNSSLYFNGASFVKVEPSTYLNFDADGDFTLECWFNVESWGPTQWSTIFGTTPVGNWSFNPVYSGAWGSPRYRNLYLMVKPTGIQFSHANMTGNSDPNGEKLLDANYNFSLNTWYHVAVVCTKTPQKFDIYVNGSLVMTGGSVAQRPLDIDHHLFCIGGYRGWTGHPGNPFAGSPNEDSHLMTGYIQDFRVVRGALYNQGFTPPGIYTGCG